ncbi:hypothetical protein ABEB36_015689 [Hypothenemus hampei]|uniref:Envelope protein n=1 Tax=Hypothenemus hampei TaxID=57062 RepID=A0ABD1DZU5_HYPHA
MSSLLVPDPECRLLLLSFLLLYVSFCVAILATPPYTIQISTGAFWKQLPDSITYEATIPLSYKTVWPSPLDEPPNKTGHDCNSSLSITCILQHQIALLSTTFTQELRLLDNTFSFKDSQPTTSAPPKTKRSLDFIGQGFSWCCGLATHEKLQLVADNEARLEKRVHSLTDNIGTILRTVSEDSHSFRHYEKQMQTALSKTEQQIQNIGAHFNHLQNTTFFLEHHQHLLSTSIARNEFTSLHHSIMLARLLRKQSIFTACKERKLPSTIVHPKILQQDLTRLRNDLRNSNHDLAIPITDLSSYYHLPIAECSFTKSQLLILLKVPIIQEGNYWKLFELISVPFAWYNQTCSIPRYPLFIATTHEHPASLMQIRQISGANLHHCKPYHDKLCYLPHFSSEATEGPTCAKILFLGGTLQELSQQCPITCHASTTMLISEVQQDTYIVTHPKLTLKITCHNSTITVPAKYTHQGAIKLQLPCYCFLSTLDEIIIPKRFPCISDNIHSQLTHIIPGVWTQTKELLFNPLEPHLLPTYTTMEACLNPNWTIEIPHLNLTSHATILRDLQARIYQTEVHHTHSVTSVSLLLYWNIALTLVLMYILYRFNPTLVALPTVPSVHAAPLIPFHFLTNIPILLLSICIFIFTLFLVYYLYKKLRSSCSRNPPPYNSTSPELEEVIPLTSFSLGRGL